MKKYVPQVGTVLSAALYSFSLAPWEFGFLVWFCLAPWLLVIESRKTTYEKIIQALWFSFFFGLLTIFFLVSGFQKITGVSYAVAAVSIIPYFFIHKPQYLIFAAFESKYKKYSVGLQIFFMATAFAAADYFVPRVFPDGLAMALQSKNPLVQAADLGGLPLLNFLCFLVNLTVAKLWLYRKTIKDIIFSAGAVFVVMLIFSVYGLYRVEEIKEWQNSSSEQLHAAVIQGNISGDLKNKSGNGDRGARDFIVNKYLELSRQALILHPDTEVLIWPETSYPDTFNVPQMPGVKERLEKVQELLQQNNKALIFGGYDYDLAKKEKYNSVGVLSPREPVQFYHKNILLAGGEYWPLSDVLPVLKELLPDTGNFGRGASAQNLILELAAKKIQFAPLICFEAVFAAYAAEQISLGATILVNVTDDMWFEPSSEPQFHLNLTRFTSIATRKPQIRATNTGISALIRPDGEIVNASPELTEGIFYYEIPLLKYEGTAFMSWGRFLPWVFAVLAIVGILKPKSSSQA